MVIGIGCDVVEHSVTKKLKWKSDSEILHRLLTQKEFDFYCMDKNINFLAGRFAAKEAVLKCLGTGMLDGISLTDIEVLHLKNGKPIIKLSGKLKKISKKIGVRSWHVSITHSRNYSFALAVAENR
jgi:holo-[acyl-carrier protein] synthase